MNWRGFTLAACIFLNSTLNGQETFPVNGVHDVRHTVYAFTNATIYIGPDRKVDSATMLVQDGKVISISQNAIVPPGAIRYDCSGKTIYPSFIDLNAGWNVERKKKKGKASVKNAKHSSNWNPAIHPEEKFELDIPLNKKIESDWLASGIGVANVHRRDGIMRGTSQLITLGQRLPNEAIIKMEAANQYSFSKGSSKNDYPSSLIGSIALIRQTLYDAQWYSVEGHKKEMNASLAALQNLNARPNIFELKSSLDVRNVQHLTSEFNVPFLMVGTGKEYLVLDEIAPESKFIIPINYPKAFDVSDPYLARMVSLAELKHWEAAPFNATSLMQKGVPFCITRDTMKSSKVFLTNLRKTVESGLSHDDALASLTSVPAAFFRIDGTHGTLDNGKAANFLVCNTTFDQDNFKIETHWTGGAKVYESAKQFPGMPGKYNLVVDKMDYEVEVKSASEKGIKASIQAKDKTKLNIEMDRKGDLISMVVTTKDSLPQLLFQLTGKVTFDEGVWDGKGQNARGEWTSWAAIRDRNFEPETESTSDSNETEIPKISHPQMAYGWDTLNTNNTFVITNAIVWTAADTGILEHVDIYIVDGKIKSIGSNILFPTDVRRINANGRHVTPGIIDEHSHIGIRGGVNEWAQSSSAEVRIEDAINPWNINIYRQLAGGVTTAQLLHGSANPIGGQSAIVKLKWGKEADEMLFDGAPGFIKFALGENVKRSNRKDPGKRFPLTRMGVEQTFMDAFIRAQEYQQQQADGSPVRRDLELDALVEILNEERFITCHSYVQSEILMLMNVADSLDFKVNTFTHILEGYKVSDEMKAHGANASTFSDWWAYKYEVNDAIPYNAAMLTNAGINTAINSDDAEMGRRLNQEAAKSMKYGGLTEEEAIKLVTINPAKMLHIDDRVGSIEIGKDADLIIWSDNPLSVYSHVDKTFIEGVVYYDDASTKKQNEFIQAERARLISKMLLDKSQSKKTPKLKKHKEMHCDTMLEEYMIEW